jgi:hypothetical protein
LSEKLVGLHSENPQLTLTLTRTLALTLTRTLLLALP